MRARERERGNRGGWMDIGAAARAVGRGPRPPNARLGEGEGEGDGIRRG